jgi:hypothetical protein
MRSISQGVCIPFRLRQGDIGDCELSSEDRGHTHAQSTSTRRSRNGHMPDQPQRSHCQSVSGALFGDERCKGTCRNQLGIINHDAGRSKNTPSLREVSRRSPPHSLKRQERGKTGFNQFVRVQPSTESRAPYSIAGNQT